MGFKGNIEIVLRTRDLEAKISMERKHYGRYSSVYFLIYFCIFVKKTTLEDKTVKLNIYSTFTSCFFL